MENSYQTKGQGELQEGEYNFDVIISNPDFGVKTVYVCDKNVAEKLGGKEFTDSDYYPAFCGYPVGGFSSYREAVSWCQEMGLRIRK